MNPQQNTKSQLQTLVATDQYQQLLCESQTACPALTTYGSWQQVARFLANRNADESSKNVILRFLLNQLRDGVEGINNILLYISQPALAAVYHTMKFPPDGIHDRDDIWQSVVSCFFTAVGRVAKLGHAVKLPQRLYYGTRDRMRRLCDRAWRDFRQTGGDDSAHATRLDESAVSDHRCESDRQQTLDDDRQQLLAIISPEELALVATHADPESSLTRAAGELDLSFDQARFRRDRALEKLRRAGLRLPGDGGDHAPDVNDLPLARAA